MANMKEDNRGTGSALPNGADLFAFLSTEDTEFACPILKFTKVEPNQPRYEFKSSKAHQGSHYCWEPRDKAVLPFQGYKFHLTADESNIDQVCSLLPILREIGIRHKIVEDSDLYLEALSEKRGNNRGKLITIYPQDDLEVIAVAKKLSEVIEQLGIRISDKHQESLADSNLAQGDLQVGNSGLFSVRYGNMGGEVINIDGKNVIPVTVNGVGFEVKHFDDVARFIFDEKGTAIIDDRKRIPDWIKIPDELEVILRK